MRWNATLLAGRLPDKRPATTVAVLTRRQFAKGIALSGIVGGCTRADRAHHYELLTFSTSVKVTLYSDDQRRTHTAFGALRRRFATINRDWHSWGEGELGQINAALAAGQTARVSAPLAAVIRRAIQLKTASGGRFDPAIGNLVALWRFVDFARATKPVRLPADDAIDAALADNAAGFTLTRNGDEWQIDSRTTGLRLDLGAIAKGAALQEAVLLLTNAGIRRGLIDAGGDIATFDQTLETPFLIGLRDPRASNIERGVTLMPGEAIMSSGDYERFWMLDGQRYQHIIDPRTGLPVQAAQAATVIAHDPLLADAAATALVVGGRADFLSLCDAMQVDKALLVDNQGQLIATAPMQRRLRE